MDKPHQKTRLTVLANLSLVASLAFVVFSVFWFVSHNPRGDMAAGIGRITITAILFLIACFLMVLSALSRYLLLRTDADHRTTKQYVILGITAVPAVIIVLSLIVFLVGIFYESYIM